MQLRCTICKVRACALEPGAKPYPAFCPMAQETLSLDTARRIYTDPETRRLALAAAQTEADGYPDHSRVEDVMGYARRIGATHLGIATCVGLMSESALLAEILEINGFTVSAVGCKVGSIPKEEVGLRDEDKIRPCQFEALCNPVAQALLLNEAGVQLNVLMGLCVGHDSLFFRHAVAPTTVLVAKDRRTGHNPVAALYTSHSYYRARLKGGSR